MKDIIVNVSIEINAPISKVWKALVTPSIIKEYMFGTETTSDWKVGSRISYKGVWEGKEYEDGGIITEFSENKVFESTYFSSMSGEEDLPENYSTVRYEVAEMPNGTLLTISQDNCKDKERADHSSSNWNYILKLLKEIVER
jgi:uncharacterized protein YndB with AHSA1/START domain